MAKKKGKKHTDSVAAGTVLVDHLRHHTERLRRREGEVRDGEPDGIHQMRVESRRLRTALAVYRPLLDKERAEALRAELAWLSTSLSPARDLEVVEEMLLGAIAAEPRSLVAGPVRVLTKRRLREMSRPARQTAYATLDNPRYVALHDDLEAFVTEPAFAAKADRKASRMFPTLLVKPWRRLHRLSVAANEAEPRDRDSALHEVRKAAKRLRYASDVAASSLGRPATDMSRLAEGIQDALGHHHDTVVMRQWLRRLARDPEAGAATFTFGRLHASAESGAVRDIHEYERTWAKLQRHAADVLPTT